MPLILGTNSIKDATYNVANSVRFNHGEDGYLSRTASSGSYGTTYTISFWFKNTHPTAANEQYIYMGGDQNTSNNLWIRLNGSSRTLYLRTRTSGSNDCVLITNRVFRDHSAWYHVVYEIDTTQGTASNRVKLYINGAQETSFGTETYPDQNDTFKIATSGKNQDIGRRTDGSSYNNFGLMLAEFCLIDGTALDKDSFGEFDEDSPLIWKPKSVSGLTFGTNGFYLDFEDSSALGNDVSGNNNDFSSSGLAATDQSTDTCTNNYITLNPINADLSNSTLTEGNLQFAGGDTSVNYDYVAATIAPSAGKWYWEVKAVDNAEIDQVGVAEADLAIFSNASNSSGLQATTYGGKSVQFSNGNKAGDGSQSSYMGGFSANDIMMIALDLDNGNIYYGRNGQWANGSGGADQSFPGTAAFTNLTAGAAYVPAHCMRAYGGSNTGESEYNFGSPPYSISSGNTDGNGYGNFEYSVPSIYYAINTKNLAEFG